MLFFVRLLPVLTLFALAGCQIQEIGPVPENQHEVFITADLVDETPDTRTSSELTTDGKTRVYWSPGDKIKVFSAGESSVFTSQNTAPSRTAKFKGTVSMIFGDDGEGETDYIWGLYPNRDDAAYSEPSGSSSTALITTTLPSVQQGKEDSFADNTFITIGRSAESLRIPFKGVCTGVYITFETDTDIDQVTLRGLDGETLAGRFSAGLNEGTDGSVTPYIESVSEPSQEVTVLAPDGGTFKKDKKYYIITLPVQFTRGFSLTAHKTTGETGTCTIQPATAPEFKMNSIGSVKKVDNRITTWTQEGPAYNEIWYTSIENAVVSYSPSGTAVNIVNEANCVAPADNGGVGIIRFTEPVTVIEDEAFARDENLTSVILPNSVEAIGTSAFEYCSNLWVADLGTGLKTIGAWAFGNCRFSTIDFLPEGLKNIGTGAFSENYNLRSVTIPDSVENIQYYTNYGPMGSPFYGCSNLERFSGKFASTDGRALLAPGSNGLNYLVSFATGGYTGPYVIPDGVDAIAHFAFWCATFSEVTLPQSLRLIQDAAFYMCTDLMSITIPAGVQQIGGYAFYNCNSLQYVEINSPAVPVASYTYSVYRGGIFDGSTCPIIVPEDLVEGYKSTQYWSDYDIRYNMVVNEDSYVIYYTTTDGNAVTYSFDGSSGNVLAPPIIAPNENGGVGIIRFENPVVKIDDKAFYGVENLRSITLPDCVGTIGDNSFEGCTNLNDIDLGTGITTIGSFAFCGCGFEVVDFLPEGLKRIGRFAFDDCPNLLSVTIPESVELLGYYNSSYTVPLGNPFLECPKLQSFHGKGATSDGRALIMTDGDGTRHLIGFAGYGMDYGTYTVPDVDVISFYAFYACTLAQVILPENLSVISDRAFQNSEILSSVTIPSKVTAVGGQSFSGCYNLGSIRIETPYVPAAQVSGTRYINGKMFDGSSCAIYVPEELLSSYLGANYWSDYASRYQPFFSN